MDSNANQDSLSGPALHSWRVRVSGRVQGVYFRAFTQAQAMARRVRGWVRNEEDGSVLALLQHEDAAVLERLLDELREGPPMAEVERLEVEGLTGHHEAHEKFMISR